MSGTDYVSGSVFRHSRIEYGTGVLLTDSYPYFSNNTFYKNNGNAGAICSTATVLWTGIEMSSGALVVKNNVFDSNLGGGFGQNGSTLGSKFFSVLSNRFVDNLRAAVSFYSTGGPDSFVDIASNFMGGNASGIAVSEGGPSGVLIRNNTITGSRDAACNGGIAIDIYNGSPHITHNLIVDNKQGPGFCNARCAMISIFTSGQPAVVDNTFSGNQADALVYFRYGGGGAYHGNNLANSQVQHVFYREPQSMAGADASGNYWGTVEQPA